MTSAGSAARGARGEASGRRSADVSLTLSRWGRQSWSWRVATRHVGSCPRLGDSVVVREALRRRCPTLLLSRRSNYSIWTSFCGSLHAADAAEDELVEVVESAKCSLRSAALRCPALGPQPGAECASIRQQGAANPADQRVVSMSIDERGISRIGPDGSNHMLASGDQGTPSKATCGQSITGR
jgi:hypothetical protein